MHTTLHTHVCAEAIALCSLWSFYPYNTIYHNFGADEMINFVTLTTQVSYYCLYFTAKIAFSKR